MGVGGQRHAPVALPPEKTRYPLYRRLGGPQNRSGRVRKISPPPEFDPWTVHPVASRYTHWAIPAHENKGTDKNLHSFLLTAMWTADIVFTNLFTAVLTRQRKNVLSLYVKFSVILLFSKSHKSTYVICKCAALNFDKWKSTSSIF
jgi:hypothetical protein